MPGIDLKDAIKTIKSGEWISMQVITADVKKGTGGFVINLDRCRIARRQLMEAADTLRNSFTGIVRSANHNFHFTMNVELPNKQIRKIHPILITQINNQQLL